MGMFIQKEFMADALSCKHLEQKKVKKKARKAGCSKEITAKAADDEANIF